MRGDRRSGGPCSEETSCTNQSHSPPAYARGGRDPATHFTGMETEAQREQSEITDGHSFTKLFQTRCQAYYVKH